MVVTEKKKHFVRRMARGFNRLALIAFVVIFQFIFVNVLMKSLSLNFTALHIVFVIFSFISVIHLQSRDMMAEMKYSWVILILLLPEAGWFIYLVMSDNRMLSTRRKLLRRINEHSRRYYYISKQAPFGTDEFIGEEIEEEGRDEVLKKLKKLPSPNAVADEIISSDFSGLFKYISVSSANPPYAGDYTEYYPCGEDFFSSLKTQLSGAKKFIFMEYFIVAEGEMFSEIYSILEEKVKEGVEVRLMYDDIGSIGTVSFNFDKKLIKSGIKAHKFNPFVPVISAVQNNRDHRKITVIDGETVFLGGSNVADEYINKIRRFGKWKDSSVMIKGASVKSVTLMFLQLWALQDKRVEDFSLYMDVPVSPYSEVGTVQPFGDGPKPIYEENITETVYVSLIEQAKRRIWIMTPYFVTDKRITDAVKTAKRRGVDVRIIIPAVPDKKFVYLQTRRTCYFLFKAGVKIYRYTPGFLHSKNVYIDDETAVCGTVNFDYRSLCHHYECAVLLKGTPSVKAMKEDFISTFKKSELLSEKSARLNPFLGLIADVGLIFTPLL